MKNLVVSEDFIQRHKTSQQAFTRRRALPFDRLFFFLIGFLRTAIQTELNNFFAAINDVPVPTREVTASAFFQARKNLKHEAFIEANHRTCDEVIYSSEDHKTWKGHRVLAMDGSTINVPNNDSCKEAFTEVVTGSGSPYVQARISQCFDVLNEITLDARIGPLTVGEREMALKHCQQLRENDLLLLDRGYPAYWLFSYLQSRNVHYVARLCTSAWAHIIDPFLASGEPDIELEISPSKDARKKCKELGIPVTNLPIRLVRIDIESPDGPVVVATSLFNRETNPADIFQELYHDRWPVEEDYKRYKCRIEIENFTGCRQENVKQDFYASVFAHNLTAVLAMPVHSVIAAKTEQREHQYKINWTQVYSKFRHCGIRLFITNTLNNVVETFQESLQYCISIVRPGRSYPRNHSKYARRYVMPYKPIS